MDPTAAIDPRATIVEPVRICAGAAVSGAVTVGPFAVVGEAARVERDLTRAVVWACATANAANAGESIVT